MDLETSGDPSPYIPLFESFRKELDEHHDRRERVIKRSRDITAASKKMMRTVNRPIPAHVQKAIQPHETAIATNYAEVAKDLQGMDSYRYSRNITGGNQEFMESATFSHYLTTGRLLTYEESCQTFNKLCAGKDEAMDASSEQGPQLSIEDYVLGLYDMTGELMRFAITAMATGGALPPVTDGSNAALTEGGGERTVLTDLRALSAGLEGLEVGHGSSFARDIDKKMDVMRNSVEKVEKALYGLVVRGAERPKGWMPDVDSGGRGRAEVDVEG
ncbi:hypothetical protein ANO11243_064620 [Dothideomycetidae sp. 11243]|nr:hypothetical protein ANO11243_064620 [fungal sp. No.11243]